MSVLPIVVPKCTLAALLAASGSHGEYEPRALLRLKKMGQADGRTPDRYITLTERRGQRYKIQTLCVKRDRSQIAGLFSAN